MKIRIQVIDAEHQMEVLVINGGEEQVAATLADRGDWVEVEVLVPQAIVVRQHPDTHVDMHTSDTKH